MPTPHPLSPRTMSATTAVRSISLMVGGYLILLALLSGVAPKLVLSLANDSLVVRALALTLLLSAGSIAWIGGRAGRDLRLIGPLAVAGVLGVGGLVIGIRPSVMTHPLVLSFPAFLSWSFGLAGVLVLLLARWYGRSP